MWCIGAGCNLSRCEHLWHQRPPAKDWAGPGSLCGIRSWLYKESFNANERLLRRRRLRRHSSPFGRRPACASWREQSKAPCALFFGSALRCGPRPRSRGGRGRQGPGGAAPHTAAVLGPGDARPARLQCAALGSRHRTFRSSPVALRLCVLGAGGGHLETCQLLVAEACTAQTCLLELEPRPSQITVKLARLHCVVAD